MSMRMAVKAPGEANTGLKGGGVSVQGRLKSDITHGKEKIYERSYY